MSIDWDKPYTTRDGREVRIYTTEGRKRFYPVAGEYLEVDGRWEIGRWTSEGHWNCACIQAGDMDIVNVPQKHTVWISVYRDSMCSDGGGWAHKSKAAADEAAAANRIACFEHTFTEGEGLE